MRRERSKGVEAKKAPKKAGRFTWRRPRLAGRCTREAQRIQDRRPVGATSGRSGAASRARSPAKILENR
jgi:hypothetical protein